MVSWVDHAKMPPMSLKTAFTRYVDINTPPSQALLKQMSTLASDKEEQKKIQDLSTVTNWQFFDNELYVVSLRWWIIYS